MLAEFTEQPRLGRTNLDTGRQKAFGDSMIAESTFVGDFLLRVKKAGAVRTGLDAITTADTMFVVHQNHAVTAGKGSPDRTNLNTGRIGAMVTQLGNEESAKDLFLVLNRECR